MSRLSRIQETLLIARCIASDDRDAFGQLVTAYTDDIMRLLLSLTRGDAALAGDLAQETFIKAYLSLRSFNGIARFRTWIYRIAYNQYVDHMRRQRPTESLDGHDRADEGPDPAETERVEQSLHEAVMRLPERERVVTQLYYFDEMPVSRISSVTGMPAGTIKSYLHRSRARLATLLEQYDC